MKKFLGLLCAFVGLLLTAVGIAGVVLLGTDNTVESPATTLELGDAKAVVSTPGLLAFKDTTMRLTAESPGGAVFIGQAHPIDAKSYLSTAPTYAVTRVDTSGTGGEVVKGDARAALPDPAKQTFWTAKATGTGRQTLTLELDGTPTEYVVMPIGKPGDVTLTSGIQIKNGFALSIGAIVIGLLTFIGGLLVRRRRKSPAVSWPQDDSAEETAGTAVGHQAAAADAPAAASRTMKRIVTIGVIGAVVPVLAGCGVVPTRVDAWKSSELTKPAMANRAEAVAAMKDYDVRNNAAIKQSAQVHDPVAWAKADTGMLFAQDKVRTAVRKIQKDKDTTPVSHTVKGVYSPAFAGYPMYSILDIDVTARGRTSHGVAAVTKHDATSPWLKSAHVGYTLAEIPAALPSSKQEPLTDPQKARLLAQVGTLTKQLNAGKGALVNGELLDTVEDFMGFNGKPATFRFWSSEADQFGPRGSIQAVKVAGDATLAVVNYQADTVHDAGQGNEWMASTLDNDYLRATGQVTESRTIRIRNGVTMVLLMDRSGALKTLAVGADGVPL